MSVYIYIYIYILTITFRREKSSYGLVVKVLDCNIIESQFKIQSCYYVVEKRKILYFGLARKLIQH